MLINGPIEMIHELLGDEPSKVSLNEITSGPDGTAKSTLLGLLYVAHELECLVETIRAEEPV